MSMCYKVAWVMPASEDGAPLPNARQYDATTHSATAADTLLELLNQCPQVCSAWIAGRPKPDWPL